MKYKLLSLTLLVIIWLTSACTSSESPTQTSEAIPSELPTATQPPPTITLEPAHQLPEPTEADLPTDNLVFNNLVYQKGQLLNVYLPPEGSKPYPTLLIFPDVPNYAYQYGGLAEYFVQKDYAVVSIDYNIVEWTDQAPCALAWVQSNATEYGFDPQKIAVFGHHWSGSLAAWLGTTDEPGLFLKSCEQPKPDNDAIKGIIIWSSAEGPKGILCSSYSSLYADDFNITDEEVTEVCDALENTPPQEWRGIASTFRDVLSNYINESPFAWLDSSDPPFLLLDYVSNSEGQNTEDFSDEVQLMGGTADVIILDEAKGTAPLTPNTPGHFAMREAIEVFLAEIFSE